MPAFKNNEVVLVLDIDSSKLNDFDETDQEYLGQVVNLIEHII